MREIRRRFVPLCGPSYDVLTLPVFYAYGVCLLNGAVPNKSTHQANRKFPQRLAHGGSHQGRSITPWAWGTAVLGAPQHLTPLSSCLCSLNPMLPIQAWPALGAASRNHQFCGCDSTWAWSTLRRQHLVCNRRRCTKDRMPCEECLMTALVDDL